MTSPKPGMPSSFYLGYPFPCWDVGDRTRRLNDAPRVVHV